ncbi:MAG TPA: GlmU family protein [Saprospiraceae bacterium]|nr:GlmU family protein [Saprospiraceae bacterium]
MKTSQNLILFDDEKRDAFLPLVWTRPLSELRLGINTIREKWERIYGCTASFLTQEYLSAKFPLKITEDNLLINSRYLPNEYLISLLRMLELNQAIMSDNDLVAVRLTKKRLSDVIEDEDIESLDGMDIDSALFRYIEKPWQLFLQNGLEIENDMNEIKKTQSTQDLPDGNQLIGDAKHLFIEEGVQIQGATLNTTTGPIYLGKGSEVMEGSLIRGPFALLDHGVVKMGAKVYGATTVGPHSKIGGEVNNSVILGYSNKGHDGFLGNSLIGEWCNIGADTNNSNLKNNYGEVKLWSYVTQRFEPTGQQFLGLVMGDHSKCGINTMFNTGTAIGVATNVFGGGFPRNFIPSFSWGGSGGYSTHRLEKAAETAEIMMDRRQMTFSEEDRKILAHILQATSPFRSWEK